MDDKHLREAATDHEPQVTIGWDGGSDGRGVVWTQSLDGGQWTGLGYCTDDGLTFTEEPPQAGRAGYDKTPEATRRRAAAWTDRSWLDIDRVVNDFAAQEEHRLRDWRARAEPHRAEPLREHASTAEYWMWRGTNVQDGHRVIDGEFAETPDPLADLPPHVAESYDRLRAWARSRVDWPPMVADWEHRYGRAASARMAEKQTAWGRVFTVALDVLAEHRSDPHELARWEDDGGR